MQVIKSLLHDSYYVVICIDSASNAISNYNTKS